MSGYKIDSLEAHKANLSEHHDDQVRRLDYDVEDVALSSDMARDLVSRPLRRFSHNQLVWLHILANEASKPDPDPQQ